MRLFPGLPTVSHFFAHNNSCTSFLVAHIGIICTGHHKDKKNTSGKDECDAARGLVAEDGDLVAVI